MNNKIIIALPGGKYGLAAPWFAAGEPGAIGGQSQFTAPVYMVIDEFDSEEAAQERWRQLAGL